MPPRLRTVKDCTCDFYRILLPSALLRVQAFCNLFRVRQQFRSLWRSISRFQAVHLFFRNSYYSKVRTGIRVFIGTAFGITIQNPLCRAIPAQTYEKRGICCAWAAEMKAVKNHNQQITIHNRFGRLRSWSFVAAAINIIRNIARAAISTETG